MTTETENGMVATTNAQDRRDRRIRDAQHEVEKAQIALESARKQLDKAITAYPKEPVDGAVIRFSLRLDQFGNKVYHYAAIRIIGRWYTTGNSCPKAGWSWYELIDFIREAEYIYTEPYELLGHTARPIEL